MRDSSLLLEELRGHPDVVILIDQMNKTLAEEGEKRREYRELVHENVKAEFINGEIIFHSPVKRKHWRVSMNLCIKLGAFVNENGLGEVGSEKVMISLTRNDYEPDIVFFSKEKAEAFEDDQMIFPAPDFIVEILSESTEKYDRNEKFIDYAAHGVSEYWIIDPEAKTLEQYVNLDSKFSLSVKLQKGSVESKVISGFAIGLKEIFSDQGV